MGVSFVAIGTKVQNTGANAIPFPAGVAADQLAVTGRVLWLSSGTYTTPSGWTFHGELAGGVNSSADDHTTKAALYTKELTGSESGTESFGGSGASNIGVMLTYARTGAPWSLAYCSGTDDTHGSNRSVTASTSVDLSPGDVVVAVVAVDTDVALTITGEAITAPGITFGTTTRRTPASIGSTGGQDGNMDVFEATVTSGSGTVAPTLAFTTTTLQCGPVLFLRMRSLDAPDDPTTLVATPEAREIVLTWAAPTGGTTPTGYDVRLDGGTPIDVGDVLTYTFEDLVPDTAYTLEVRAYNLGGDSDWVSVGSTTLELILGSYLVEVDLGSHSWSFEYGDTVDLETGYPHLVLPLTCGWDMPDTVDFFPVAPNLTTMSFRVQCDDAADLDDVVKGTPVAFKMWTEGADLWQRFDGVVTQLDAVTVRSPADPTKRDLVVTVFAADNNARLYDLPVGWSADWPIEHIDDRVERIATEAGIPYDRRWDGGVGWLSARLAGSPMSAYAALQQALKDAAEEYDSEPPDVWYGRPVFQYEPGGLLDDFGDPVDEVLACYSIRRRLFDGYTVTLDGGLVRAAGSWSKLPGPAAHTWGVVDTTTFGTPDSSVPFYRSTSLLDTFDVPGDPVNHSATERNNLGESLLADGSTALDGWASRSLVYEAWRDPLPVARWANLYRYEIAIRPVVVTPIGPELELNGVDYVAGTLVGARLTIPASGRYTVEFRLRSELLDGTDLP